MTTDDSRAGFPGLRQFPFGNPTAASWREHALTQIAELEYVKAWAVGKAQPQTAATRELAGAVEQHLRAAYQTVTGRPPDRTPRLLSGWSGARVERTLSHLDSARAHLLRLAPLDYVRGQLPGLLAHVRAHLPRNDPRRQEVEALASQLSERTFSDVDRDVLVAGFRDASAEGRAEVTRVRSFRNVLLSVAGLLTIAAVAVALLGSARPALVHLCFNPAGMVVCPTGQSTVATGDQGTPTPAELSSAIEETASPWDLFVVELVGLLAAAVTAAAVLRNIRGTSTPYSLPVALAVLKLPTGALTAVLGLLLMRGEFVPGLSALDSSGQILAWAIVFGSAQQLALGLVDRQAQSVLDQVGEHDEKDVKTGNAAPAGAGAPAGGTATAAGGTSTAAG